MIWRTILPLSALTALITGIVVGRTKSRRYVDMGCRPYFLGR